MPDNWLKDMIEYGKAIPNTGIMATKVAGWESVISLEYNTPSQIINEKEVIVCRAIGPRMFSREVFKKCGFRAMQFRVGGDEGAVKAKRRLHALLARFPQLEEKK